MAEKCNKSMVQTVSAVILILMATLLASCTTSKGSFTDGMYIQGGVGTTI